MTRAPRLRSLRAPFVVTVVTALAAACGDADDISNPPGFDNRDAAVGFCPNGRPTAGTACSGESQCSYEGSYRPGDACPSSGQILGQSICVANKWQTVIVRCDPPQPSQDAGDAGDASDASDADAGTDASDAASD